MTLRRQELTAGDDSTVYQAAGDIHQHQHGPSFTEMRQVALDVYRANALELRGIAEDTANARAERITNEYLTRLMIESPSSTPNLADPDVQNVMFEAQKAFARSGEEDLETVLVDLLTDRTTETQRSLRTLVLNEAITAAPKLTSSQRRIIALIFLLRYTKVTSPTALQFMAYYVRRNIMALGRDLSHSPQDIQHLEYVGVASSTLAEVDFGTALVSGSEGLFTRGFSVDVVPQHIRESPQFEALLVPCTRTPEHLQVAGRGDDDIPDLAEKLGVPEWTEELTTLAKNGRMQPHEVVEEAARFEPGITAVAEAWGKRQYAGLTLTSVGIAIGHSQWKRVTGDKAPLSTWL